MSIEVSDMDVEQLRTLRAKIDAILDGPGEKVGDLNSVIAEMQSVKTRVAEVGKAAVAKSIVAFMNAHPEVHSIRWHQYTPYFNDGDECRFRVNDPGVRLIDAADDEEGGDYDDGYFESWSLKYAAEKGGKPVPKSLIADLDQLESLFSNAEDALKVTFGDHVKVIVGRDGQAEVTEYEHD